MQKQKEARREAIYIENARKLINRIHLPKYHLITVR